MYQSHARRLGMLAAMLVSAAAFSACGEGSPRFVGSTSSAVEADTCASGTFVFTNNGVSFPSNTVSAFCVDGSTGALTEIAGSPFATGARGGSSGYGTSEIAATKAGNFLYASNVYDSTISGFSVDGGTGSLTPLTSAGSPFPPAGDAASVLSLAVTPDSRFLIAAYGGSQDIAVFGIDSTTGALTPVSSGLSLGTHPQGIKISPDGRWLAVALDEVGEIAMFGIGLDGSLSAVNGSPFSTPFNGQVLAVDINTDSTNLYASGANLYLFRIGSDGALTLAQQVYPGGQSPVLSPDDSKLFGAVKSNPMLNGVWSWTVDSGGFVSLVNGSPFSDSGGPVYAATTRSGQFLYTANVDNTVAGFSVGSDGSLTAVAGGPSPTNQVGFLTSLAVVPPAQHVLAVQIRIKLDAPPPVPVSLKSKGSVPVAILSSAGFDAPTEVNATSVTFAGEAPLTLSNGSTKETIVDVNADGLPDLVLYFAYAGLDLNPSSTSATLIGATVRGASFAGTEAIKVVP